jgi:hypothetical protein
MKRSAVIIALISVSILATWANSQASAASPPETESDNSPIKVHYDTDEIPKDNQSGHVAVPAEGMDFRIAPVFDTTGAVISDPSGILMDANHSVDKVIPVISMDAKIAPVFDATGAVMSDPTGTMFGANRSGNKAVSLTVANMRIAPVFDATGAVVSDPTGTLLSVIDLSARSK